MILRANERSVLLASVPVQAAPNERLRTSSYGYRNNTFGPLEGPSDHRMIAGPNRWPDTTSRG